MCSKAQPLFNFRYKRFLTVVHRCSIAVSLALASVGVHHRFILCLLLLCLVDANMEKTL